MALAHECVRWWCHYPRVQLLRLLRRGAGRVDATVALRSLDQQWRIPIRRRHWKLLEETTDESVRMRETQRKGTTVTEMTLTTPLMPFLPTGPLGTTTKYDSMPLSFRYSQRSPPFPGSTSNSPCRHSRVFWEMCTRLPDTCVMWVSSNTTSCFTHYTTLVDNCCFTAQNYRDNSLTGFRIHSWTLFDSLK